MFRARSNASRGRRGFRSVAGGGAAPLPPLSNALTQWRESGLSGKKILVVSDSTSASGAPPLGNTAGLMNANYCQPGQILYGAFFQDGALNGASLTQYMSDSIATGITWTLGQDFDVILMGYGINDVRGGSVNQASLQAMLVSFVNQIHTARPNAEIILWGPGSFLTTDVAGNGYVTPNASAQAYTDAMRNAYAGALAANPGWASYVTVLQRQDVTGTTCLASSALMADQIHNSPSGYAAINVQLSNALRPLGWPYAPGTDPLWNWTRFGLNGTLTDITGRHTVSVVNSGVTASGGVLTFNGNGGLQLGGNLTDFDFGNNLTMQKKTRLTIEMRVKASAVSRPGGHCLWSNGSQYLAISPDPTSSMLMDPPSGKNNGGPYATGATFDMVWVYSLDQVSLYAGPAGTVLNKINGSPDFGNANFNAGSGNPMFIGQQSDAWTLAMLIGDIVGVRVTWANRTNHAATYAALPYPFPTVQS